MQAESVRVFALSLCPPSAYLVVFVLYIIIQKKWREKRKDEYGGSYFIFLVSFFLILLISVIDVERD